MKSSVITRLGRPESTMGTAATELGKLNVMGVIRSQVTGTKWRNSINKGKVGMVTEGTADSKQESGQSDSQRPRALVS